MKARADQLAFEQGLAESREKAKSLIMAGRIIPINQRAGASIKPGQQFPTETLFRLLPGQEYVSRGAFKLITILDGFRLDVRDYVCLDAGASTGGFTDCLLKRGARKVYAVDVGKNQLHEKLKADPRVINLEGVNLRHASPDLIPEQVDLITGDVSFISLTLVLPPCAHWLKKDGLAALLVKPQFELSPAQVKKGVVHLEADRQKAVNKIVDFCTDSLGWTHLGTLPAQLKGPKGNQEFMTLFQKS